MKTIKDFLKKTDLFSDFSDEELSEIISLIQEEHYEKDEYVFTSHDTGKKLFIVKEGSLALNIGSNRLREFGPYDIFGEVALISENLRIGNVKAKDASTLYALTHDDLITCKKIPATLALKILRILAKKVATYLQPQAHTSTDELIREGENDNVEFKSTLRYNLHTKKFGKEIEHAALKSVAAFMNLNGGTLIVGIDDDKNVVGLDSDNFENDDKTLLHLTNLVKERIGMNHTTFINSSIEMLNGKKVLRVDVSASIIPAYVTYNQQEYFFIRTGPSTTELRTSEIYDYIYNRFYRPKG